MSLSTDPEYLAKHGVKGRGGPHDEQYVACSGLLVRCVAWNDVEGKRIGYYRLQGLSDGGLIYVWEPFID